MLTVIYESLQKKTIILRNIKSHYKQWVSYTCLNYNRALCVVPSVPLFGNDDPAFAELLTWVKLLPFSIFFFRISVGFSCKPSVRVIFARRLMGLEEVMISYEGQDKTIKMIIFRLLVLPEIICKCFKLGDDLVVRHYAIKTPKWVYKAIWSSMESFLWWAET